MKSPFIFIILLMWGCSGGEKKENTASTDVVNAVLDPDAFKERLASNQNAVLIDVRTPGEVAEGIIPGAIVIDFTAPDFADQVAGLEKDKEYYVYCMVGGRSSKAANLMESTGFTRIYNLEGGYDAWVEKGFETSKPEQR